MPTQKAKREASLVQFANGGFGARYSRKSETCVTIDWTTGSSGTTISESTATSHPINFDVRRQKRDKMH
jgi:hypothetical protein